MRKNAVYAPGPLPHGLRSNVAMFLLAPLFMFLLIYWRGWSGPATTSAMLPPVRAQAEIWLALFLAMAIARWLLVHCPVPRIAIWVDTLGFACLVLPLYTAGFQYVTVAYYGTIATALLAATALVAAARLSKTAAALLAPVMCWLAFSAIAQRAVLHSLR